MGDEGRENFCALYDACFPRVWAYAVSRIGRQTAEEIVSETFAIAWRRRTSLPPDPLPWLIRVASNVMHESFRAQTRRQLLEAEMREWIANAPSLGKDIADAVIDRAEALAALGSLSEADQELVTLIAWHGLSAGQASRVLGCSRPTFFVRLHRARRRLERAIRPDGGDAPEAGSRYPHLILTEEVSP